MLDRSIVGFNTQSTAKVIVGRLPVWRVGYWFDGFYFHRRLTAEMIVGLTIRENIQRAMLSIGPLRVKYTGTYLYPSVA